MSEETAAKDRAPAAPDPEVQDQSSTDDLVEEELLVEDVSIDGMCGVY
ncbi:MAG: mycofactocin precursor MftA [Solirubrobacteraceae bacterium]